ncbi:MAG: ATP synthase F1 subunit gamma [Candidatus Gribaldobacteria bacterium]|nr:ATP synthase F1 subunit gamma [Candidatus Gribaldobacteria bacterium]
MAVSVKIIKTRIKSIKNIKKITKTMEMVAAAKMRKAIRAVSLSRNYVTTAGHILESIVDKIDRQQHPLLNKRKEIKKIGVVLFSSNRGLCGGFNAQIVSKTVDYINKLKVSLGGEIQEEWIVVGKKGALLLNRYQKNLVAVFEKAEMASTLEEILPVSKMILENYSSGSYDLVVVAFTDFVSVLKQKPQIKVVLPIDNLSGEDWLELNEKNQNQKPAGEILFEPQADEILAKFLPHLVTMQFYQALLESNASEHSSRMAAMRNASDATGDIIDSLTLTYNQVRQAGITREIAEIAGAKVAMG